MPEYVFFVRRFQCRADTQAALYRLRAGKATGSSRLFAAILAETTPMDYNMPMNTVVELPEFIVRTSCCMMRSGKS
jgi:hypothetical protein